METVELTNMCIIENLSQNKILLMNKTKGDWNGNVFPGGHIHANESIVLSTIREVKEETGLDIKNLSLVGIKNFCINDNKRNRYLVFLFKTTTYSGILTSSEEGTVFWADKNELENMSFAHNCDLNYKIMISDIFNEYYIRRDENSLEWEHSLI